MEQNKGQSYVGTVADHRQKKGWFFGAFMDNGLLRSEDVEVAWQLIGDLEPSPDQAHYHERSVEINVLIRGRMLLKIDGRPYEIDAGDFYIIWPGSVVSDISTSSDAEIIVVRAPSAPGDKVPV